MLQARALAYLVKNSRGGASSGPRLKELGGNGRPTLLGTVACGASLIEHEADAEDTPVDASMPEIACVSFELSISYTEQ